MADKLFDQIGQSNPTYLLADPRGAEEIAIPIEPGSETLERGLIMYRGDDGLYVPAKAADVTPTIDDDALIEKSLVVLNERVEQDTVFTAAARAYRAGRMIAGRVFTADEAPITAEMMLALRKQNIVFDPMDVIE